MARTDRDGAPFQPIADIDRLIHEPARLTVMTVLSIVESADFLFLMRQSGLTRGNLSSHLSKLEAAGHIEITKEFVDKIPRTLLHLTDKGRRAFEAYRKSLIEMLEDPSLLSPRREKRVPGRQ